MPAAGELRPILYGIMDLRILYHIERVGSKSVSEQSEREYDRWLLFTVTTDERNKGGGKEIKMSRAKYQVLVILYYIQNEKIHYCLFYRSDMDVWQFIAGGGEDEDHSVLISAKRETMEEASIGVNNDYITLDTISSILANCFKNARELWGKKCYVIPEYCFGVKVCTKEITFSAEHIEYEWCDYPTAVKKLKYDSNKTALWELDSRIKNRFME